ncbi:MULTISPECIES: hypothetical protein [unclassified Nocardiopsis]|uniref:class III lanthionine synthetase LanKC N-terminal domain-containing protein n=1 Tax=unclassified Nocardiopsis TaxID=2649073 RepID=UPI001356D330|nr:MULTISPECIES: hypothetical protein [unclassified Nocardiopsis]
MTDQDDAGVCTPEQRERIRRAGRFVADRGPWTDVLPPDLDLPPQGWKIHVSARPETLAPTAERVLPLLLRTPCRFKFARTARVMRELNSSTNRPGGVGKAVTVYPRPGDFPALAEKLAAELVGMEGPRSPSDRRLRPDAPVHYRYAPFSPLYGDNGQGDFHLVVRDTWGREHPGAATGRYTAPAWLPDPFTGEMVRHAPAHPAAAVLLGGRYLVPGVPRVLDHFRHGSDEFLVTDRVGPRDLGALARGLLRVLDAVHERGVLVRDLGPSNVVLAEDGTPCLVDFEISHLDGHRPHGWTPGYSSPEQERGEPARAEDDLYSLGATLLYAVTGIDPPARSTRGVPDDGRARTVLAALGTAAPPRPGPSPACSPPAPRTAGRPPASYARA